MDMEAERDYLLKHVFPDIRQRCAERRVGFTEIDLRWGITEDEAKNGRTVEICLAEIDRCREHPPYFIGFIGERYGWIPSQDQLAEAWTGDRDSPYLNAIEVALADGISVTELELRFGVLDRPSMRGHAYYFLRSAALTEQLFYAQRGRSKSAFYDDGGGRLVAFKSQLRANGLITMDGYDRIEDFGQRVKALLMAEIDRIFPFEHQDGQAAILDIEHALFAQSRRLAYTPLLGMRDATLARIGSHLDGTIKGGLLVTGVSGLGKSSLLADLAEELRRRQDYWVYEHYVGADGQRGLEEWLDRVLMAIAALLPVPTALPADIAKRWEILPLWLDQARGALGRPVVLILDALDQLHNGEEALGKLGEAFWPQGTVLIASTAAEETRAFCLWDRMELAPPSRQERKAMIAAFLESCRKSLEEPLIERLVDAPQCEVPLFLRMLLEDLRVRANRETLAGRLRTLLEFADASSLFAFLLGELDRDHADSAHPSLASRMVAMLAASRQGMTELELCRLLAGPADPVLAETGRPHLPAARLSALGNVLQPFLLRNAGRDVLMHAALARGSLPDKIERDIRHHIIATLDDDTPRSLTERVYQRLTIVERRLERLEAWVKSELAEELSRPAAMADVWREDRRVLAAALVVLGAGLHRPSDSIEMISGRFAAPETRWIAQDGHELSAWFREMGFYGLGLTWAERNLAEDLGRLNPNDPAIARGRLHIANFNMILDQPDKAEPLCQQALDNLRQTLPAGDARIGEAIAQLAECYSDLEKWDEAEKLYKQSLAFRRRYLPKGHSDIADSLAGIAMLYYREAISIRNALMKGKINRLDKAEKMLVEALSIERKTLSPGAPQLAAMLHRLAIVYLRQGQPDKAIPLLEEALVILRGSLPARHARMSGLLESLGASYRQLGDIDMAEKMHREALAIRREVLPPVHSDPARSLCNLGLIHKERGEVQLAREMLQQALDIYLQLHGQRDMIAKCTLWISEINENSRQVRVFIVASIGAFAVIVTIIIAFLI
ncbi:hypothetical protein A6A04_18710 [Paramagnetospirillum marisnigri]|uniref:DUF4062 domain-containing protein n=2 Tax=Paramagnetospirillum marisnigri TaxID=1285242 RepID=A0A178MPJ9_9PROT|nr:hypothetical protein A6A04_18710 [Paramagnetospirillum marisnigri]